MKTTHYKDQLSLVMKHLDAFIYVSDFQTYEMLFINEKLKQLIGDAVGKLCWKSMPFEQTGPCNFCTDSKSLLTKKNNKKKPVRKEFLNPANQQWFIVQEQAIPWPDGRMVRLKIMMNCHHLKEHNQNKEKKFLSNEKKIGNLAHELRTPLNAILGYTQLMLYKKDYSHGSLEYINAIHHCGEQLITMINDISSISKGNNDTKPEIEDSENRLELFNIAENILQTKSENIHIPQQETTTSKVLVVDDSSDNRKFIINTLDILGFHTKEASDGQAALEIWKTWHPDLILLDIYMPEISGHDVIKAIRKNERSEDHVIVIAVSASSFENDRNLAIASGCDDYLVKPFKLNTLIELIGKYIHARRHKKMPQQMNNKEDWLLKSIQKMPSKWLNALKKSVEMLDPIKTKYYISKLEQEDLQAASVLKDWINQFQFDRLQQLICEL